MPLYNLSASQYRGFIHFFNNYQHENKLGKRELSAILSKYGINPTESELQQMIDSISLDSTGIGLQAFVDYVSTWTGFRDQEQEFAEAFRIYDRNGDGQLSREEISYVMTKLGASKADINSIMDEADKNRDGSIQYDEFVALMKRKL